MSVNNLGKYAKYFSKKDSPLVAKLVAVEALLADVNDYIINAPKTKQANINPLTDYLVEVASNLDNLTEEIKIQYGKYYSPSEWNGMIAKVVNKFKEK